MIIGLYRAKRVVSEASLEQLGVGGGGGRYEHPRFFLCLYAPRANLSAFPT